MEENWIDIPGYEGRYQVSDLGRVRSVPRVTQRKNGRKLTVRGSESMTLTKNESGHLRVNLEGQLHYVHRLVMLAFVGPPPTNQEVCHGPTGPGDNRLKNLSYGTRSKNMYDKVADGNHYQAQKTHCPRGHLLAMPNITPRALSQGFRKCLACSKVRVTKMSPEDAQMITDHHYSRIMEESK